MKIENGVAKEVRIAYIGGGSRGWAWGLMSDLAQEKSMSGSVSLYDIDKEAARHNEIIGNRILEQHPDASPWQYKAVDSLQDALCGTDFVVISILPGTFDEMESDVHTPEKYGIYQSVGDTVGAGGIIRALRAIPMFEEIGLAIRQFCPDAWVINYTNPMTMCIRALYRVFPQIKAFGCCHEVFGTQRILAQALQEYTDIKTVERDEIKVNVKGINHFTWIDRAYYQSTDLMPIYEAYAKKHFHDERKTADEKNWFNRFFQSSERVKFDLFLRYHCIAAAGDRHLAEFCPNSWYLKDVEKWNFSLTPVAFRKKELAERLARSARMVSGEEPFELRETGEEGVKQMKAILGLGDLVTNVNLPNQGQIPNLPLNAVVETNAVFTSNSVQPVMAGGLSQEVLSLTYQTVLNQETVVEAALRRDLDMAFSAFIKDPQIDLPVDKARTLFDEMVYNTRKYLPGYQL